MKRKTAGRSAKPRVCAFCGGLMSSQLPVAMVADVNGNIVGPYHQGCAERLVLQYKGKGNPEVLPGLYQGLLIPPGREETLPW